MTQDSDQNTDSRPPGRPTLTQLLHEEILSRKAALWAMIAMSFLYLWSFFDRVAVPSTIFNELQSGMKIDASQVTGLGAMYLCIYGSMQVVVGYLADRFGGVKVLLFGGVILSLAAIVFPLSNSVTMLYACRAVGGFGASFIFLGCAKELDSLFGPRGFTLLIGPLLFFGGVGALLATFPLERLVHVAGWRNAMFVAAGCTIFTLLLLAILLRKLKLSRITPPEHAGEVNLSIMGHVREVVFRRSIMPGGFAAVSNFVCYYLLSATLGKKFLQDFVKLTSAQAAATAFGTIFCAMSVTFASGAIARLYHDRRRPMGFTCTAFSAVGYALLLAAVEFSLPAWVFVAAYLIVGVASGLAPAFNFSLKELVPPKAYGFALGYFNTLVYLGVAFTAFVSGVVLDHFKADAIITREATIYPAAGYASLFAIMLGVAVAGCVALIWMPETGGKQYSDQ